MTALHHLALGARDPDAIAAFYRDVLGLTELQRHHTEAGELRSVWLDLGQAILMIERIAADAPLHKVHMAPGLFLLAVRIEESERSAWEQRLTESGAPIEDRTGFTSYTRDPEGNRVAVSFY